MRFVFPIILMIASACASTTRHTEAILLTAPNIPAYFETHVPFILQTDNYCGPATLAMAMGWAGKPISIEKIATETFLKEKKGTLQADLIGAARREGLIAIPIQGMLALLEELAAGHPVIILENLAFSWYPKWHYALITGYDLKIPEVIMHSGSEELKHWNMRKFERSWEYSNFWGLVVLPPSILSAADDEIAHVTAAAALEDLGKNQESEQAYIAILKKWPDSLAANIGMGNIRYAQKKYFESVKFLRHATESHPNSAQAWHNRSLAEGAAKRKKTAEKCAALAMKLAGLELQPTYRESLKEWLRR